MIPTRSSSVLNYDNDCNDAINPSITYAAKPKVVIGDGVRSFILPQVQTTRDRRSLLFLNNVQQINLENLSDEVSITKIQEPSRFDKIQTGMVVC